MESKKKEQLKPDVLILTAGEQFLKELRAMPYDLSRVGQTFITFSKIPISGNKKPDSKQETPKQNNPNKLSSE
jgi:hypothetical protein